MFMVNVKLVNITKVFGKVVAVRNLNLEVKDGEFFAMLGPSGCGKTTTLRIIAGLEKPTKGRVYFDGVDVTDLPASQRDVAMVFQFYALYPTTVYNNIALPLKSRKISKKDIEKRVYEVAELLGLKEKLHVHINKLTMAEKQKVALARAIVRKPRLYLLDEPLTILDPVTKIIMRSEFKKLQKKIKQTIIYVTHDQIEAMTLADRIAVMNEGVIEQVGTPDEIYNQPNSMFVGWFIGEPGMNFVEASIDRDGKTVKIGEQILLRSNELVSKLTEKSIEKVVVGVRPEYILLLKEPKTCLKNHALLKGKVVVTEFLGTYYIVLVSVDKEDIKVKIPPSAYPKIAPYKNQEIYLAIPIERMLFFDINTGKRIL